MSTVDEQRTATPAAPADRNPLDLPRPIIRQSRWSSLAIWLVPLFALIAAGWYLRGYLADRGPDIVIRVDDANGIVAGSTGVRSKGVEIGKVTRIELTDDRKAASLRVRLRHNAEPFAQSGARFWVVRPDFTGGSISGLGTVISGPYVDSLSGDGENQHEFTALAAAPAPPSDGLRLQLFANRHSHFDVGTPIKYRGVAVGSVESVMLADDATHVNARAVIERRYAPLVRADSQFWSEAPADVKGGIFSGVEVKLGSLKTILSGGIEFASPDTPLGEPAIEGSTFALHEDAAKEWELWRPQIAITPELNEPKSDEKTKAGAMLGVK